MIRPARPRATVFDEGDSLRIVVPRPRAALPFEVLACAVWAAMGVGFMRQGFFPHGGADLGSWWFFLIWLAIGVSWGYSFLGTLFGREVARIDGELLTIATQTLLYMRTRRFGLREVRDLRVTPGLPHYAWWLRGWGWGHSGSPPGSDGPFAFDYGAKTYRFGAGVDEAEAKQLLAVILERFPSLAPSAR